MIGLFDVESRASDAICIIVNIRSTSIGLMNGILLLRCVKEGVHVIRQYEQPSIVELCWQAVLSISHSDIVRSARKL